MRQTSYSPRSFRNASVALLALAFLALPPESMAWQRKVNRTFAGGRTSSRTIAGSANSGGYTRDTTYAGPRGNTASRNAQGQWDPASKTWTENVTATGAGGQSASRSSTTSRTDNGYNRSTTVTGREGNSATRNVQGQWDPVTKTWTKEVTTSGGAQ